MKNTLKQVVMINTIINTFINTINNINTINTITAFIYINTINAINISFVKKILLTLKSELAKKS